jgi:hypothetical protein
MSKNVNPNSVTLQGKANFLCHFQIQIMLGMSKDGNPNSVILQVTANFFMPFPDSNSVRYVKEY